MLTPAKVETMAYYDVVNFARRITCPVYLTWGYNDNTCPPTTSYAVWNVLQCEKEVARLQVISATDEMSQAKVLGGEIKPDEDDEDDPYKKYVVRFVDQDQDRMNTPPPPPVAPAAEAAAPF